VNIERTELGVWLVVADAKPKEKRKRVRKVKPVNNQVSLW
jgi:hypothetical protein